MGTYVEQNTNSGVVRQFQAVGVNQNFIFGGLTCKKINDSYAVRYDNGQRIPVDPGQSVTVVAVTTVFEPLTYADLNFGDGYESGGVRWIKCEGGALNVDADQFIDNPPTVAIVKQKNQGGTFQV